MKKLSQQVKVTPEVIFDIMPEEKANQNEQVRIQADKLRKFFPKGYTVEQIEQALIQYSLKYGVTKAAIKYRTNRQYIYRWRKRYDGTLQSLADRSHRPHSHPRQHTADELKLIADMRRRKPSSFL